MKNRNNKTTNIKPITSHFTNQYIAKNAKGDGEVKKKKTWKTC